MSRPLVSHSPDLAQLEADGYDFTITDNNLLVRVPYVTEQRSVAWGTLASPLTTAGDVAAYDGQHVAYFVGATADSKPCDDQGRVLDALINQHGPIPLTGSLVASCSFSHKPSPNYANYYDKMTTYAAMLWAYAQVIDSSVTPKTFPPVPTDEGESVFRYLDSASSRTRIGAATDKLRLNKVVIVGVGGTGSYILDAVSKTPVRQIHLYDPDVLLTHNAFRAPSAASLEELRARPKKVHYFRDTYDRMHRGIVAHDVAVDASTIEELRDADYVFLSMDGGPSKRFIVDKLHEFGVPFTDAGMGVYQSGSSLGGILRVTSSIPGHSDHVEQRISFADEDEDIYDQNIQVAELNMINAALAVMRWKKHIGFYLDFEHELSTTYTIDGNHLLNEDPVPCE